MKMTQPDSLLVNLLVVDNEPEQLQFIQSWLQPQPALPGQTGFFEQTFAVEVEKDGTRVVNMINLWQPDLVLINGEMSDQRGVALCRALKDNTSLGFIPVLVLLQQEDLELGEAYVEAGADDLLVVQSKAELLARVHGLLRLKRRFDGLLQQHRALIIELERSKRELELARKESKGLSVLKDSIVRNVSHEMRTPLLQVKSSVAMLAEDARAASPNGVSVLADHATAATARLESVVQNIAQLAASLNVKSEAFQLSEAVSVATRQLGRQWASSGGVDRIKTLIGDVPMVVGDRGAVAQVLQQLADNAIKFSPRGGPVEISAEVEAGTVRVSVRDTGIGIPEDQRDSIFQAFYQIDSSSTRSFGGTGVGLAIVKLLIDTMGSKIEVDSQPGAGSTFSFFLPIAEFDDITLDRTRSAV